MSAACVCLFSKRCFQRNFYTLSDHSHCFEHSLWGSSFEEGYKRSLAFLYLDHSTTYNIYLKGVHGHKLYDSLDLLNLLITMFTFTTV